MKVLELQNLQREEGQIFYLRKYTCDAVIELPTATETAGILFTIEVNPMGKRIINITFVKPVNYPLLPVKKALTEFILTEELEGRLPQC